MITKSDILFIIVTVIVFICTSIYVLLVSKDED